MNLPQNLFYVQFLLIVNILLLVVAKKDNPFKTDKDATLYDTKRNLVDPSITDFCPLTCQANDTYFAPNSCCNFKPDGIRIEVNDNIDIFRQAVLDWHNKARNKMALGKEKRPEKIGGCPPAANMMVLNYDLELEYTSRCWGLFFQHKKGDRIYHDVCRTARDGILGGQNLVYSDYKLPNPNNTVEYFMKLMWIMIDSEVKYADESFFKSFTMRPKGAQTDIAHFSQLFWWTVTHVGCLRFDMNGYMKDQFKKGGYVRFWGICNYGSSLVKRLPGNLPQAPVYRQGKACTKCPLKSKCEVKKYPGLCGKLYKPLTNELDTREPDPDDLPVDLAATIRPNMSIFGASLIILYIVQKQIVNTM